MDSTTFAQHVVSTFAGYLLKSMDQPSHPTLNHQSKHMNQSTYVGTGEFRLAIRYLGDALYQW